MDKLQVIDAWIIRRFEVFSHWTQLAFGVKSLDWACLCFAASCFEVVRLTQSYDKGKVYQLIMDGLIMLARLMSLIECCLHKEERELEAEKGFINPKKLEYWHRLMYAVLLIVFCPTYLLPHNLNNFWFELAAFGSYFEACDDLPSSMSKIKKFFLSLLPSPELATQKG